MRSVDVCVLLFFLINLVPHNFVDRMARRIHLSWSGKNGLTSLDVKTPLAAVAWPIAFADCFRGTVRENVVKRLDVNTFIED